MISILCKMILVTSEAVCSSILVQRMVRQAFRQNIISHFTIPLGASCVGVRVWFFIHGR